MAKKHIIVPRERVFFRKSPPPKWKSTKPTIKSNKKDFR